MYNNDKQPLKALQTFQGVKSIEIIYNNLIFTHQEKQKNMSLNQSKRTACGDGSTVEIHQMLN